MIWTEDGVWLQTHVDGVLKLSGLGRFPLESVEEFCLLRRIPLSVRRPGCLERGNQSVSGRNLAFPVASKLPCPGQGLKSS